jgi:hypothetical protein
MLLKTRSKKFYQAPAIFKAAPPSGLMLDGLTAGIKAAYSTRKLLTAYAGNAMQVERDSDGATQTIGFVANVLDTASIATFCSGTTGRVSIWYDQSGGGNNLIVDTSATSLPVIYKSGSATTLNTKPALLFEVTGIGNGIYNATLSANPTNTLWQNAVVSVDFSSRPGTIAGGDVGSAAGPLQWRVDQTTGVLRILSGGVASIATSSVGLSSLTGAVVETQYNSSTGAYSFWINNAAQGSGTQAQSLVAGHLEIGQKSGGEGLVGSLGEYVAYDLVGGIPGGTRSSIAANQKAYWGTP